MKHDNKQYVELDLPNLVIDIAVSIVSNDARGLQSELVFELWKGVQVFVESLAGVV